MHSLDRHFESLNSDSFSRSVSLSHSLSPSLPPVICRYWRVQPEVVFKHERKCGNCTALPKAWHDQSRSALSTDR